MVEGGGRACVMLRRLLVFASSHCFMLCIVCHVLVFMCLACLLVMSAVAVCDSFCVCAAVWTYNIATSQWTWCVVCVVACMHVWLFHAAVLLSRLFNTPLVTVVCVTVQPPGWPARSPDTTSATAAACIPMFVHMLLFALFTSRRVSAQ